jgi:hypothetical protein
VSDDTLAALYRLAAVFVFPSLYESFGLRRSGGGQRRAGDTSICRRCQRWSATPQF